jgi:hypothetical protein
MSDDVRIEMVVGLIEMAVLDDPGSPDPPDRARLTFDAGLTAVVPLEVARRFEIYGSYSVLVVPLAKKG